MLRIVTVQVQNYCGRGSDYANRLRDMVMRNLPAGMAGTFEVFTDDPTGLDPGITSRELPVPGLKGWWNKVALFKQDLWPEGDRIVYFDLDTLITGRLDEIVAYDGEFAILRDAYQPDGWQSSVMLWRAGLDTNIWKEYALEWLHRGPPMGGDQEFIQASACHRADILQDIYPDAFVSFKATGGALPAKASVCYFHGHPRPHEVTTGWVPAVWKIGGLMRADLDSIANTATSILFANVRASCARNLPWLDYVPAHDGHAVIVGGGPSAAGFLDEIRWRQSLGQTVFGLNGAARWLKANGIVPDAQIVVDARPENLALVEFGAKRHYLASQCDPVVFKALADRPVTLWHSNAEGVADHIPIDPRPVHLIGGGSTVGLSALPLAYVLGYRKLHLYGYDSSIAETHHAYPQPANDGDIIVDAVLGERKFRAAPWMVQQAQEFPKLAADLAEMGCIITVAGDGLLPAIAHDMARAGLPKSAAQQRAEAVLSRLPEGPVRVAEIGVFKGAMSRLLLGREDLTLIMVDAWAGNGATYHGDSGDWHAGLTRAEQDAYHRAAVSAVAFAGDRAVIVRMPSVLAAERVEDGSLDAAFIDADHSYQGAFLDIAAWLPKVKPGGLLSGHDYAAPNYPKFGVKRAVDEFIAHSGLTLELGENDTWHVRLPAAKAISEAA